MKLYSKSSVQPTPSFAIRTALFLAMPRLSYMNSGNEGYLEIPPQGLLNYEMRRSIQVHGAFFVRKHSQYRTLVERLDARGAEAPPLWIGLCVSTNHDMKRIVEESEE